MMIKQLLFIKKNRLRKKSKLHKQMFMLSFDFTSLFYTLLVLGYIIVAISLEGNFKPFFDEKMMQLEAFTMEQFWLIIGVLIIFYLIRSFRDPGITFSSAEYLLTILPHSPTQVWRALALERWLKALGIFLFGGYILYVLSPTSLPLILLYVALLLGMNVMMTILQWKCFQLHTFLKVAILLGLL